MNEYEIIATYSRSVRELVLFRTFGPRDIRLPLHFRLRHRSKGRERVHFVCFPSHQSLPRSRSKTEERESTFRVLSVGDLYPFNLLPRLHHDHRIKIKLVLKILPTVQPLISLMPPQKTQHIEIS